MKIIITGSLGNISKPLATELVQKGHEITVISSNVEKQTEIEALGAKAAIGSVEDVAFLTNTFTGADAVYCMIPRANYFDPNLDLDAFTRNIGNSYAKAIQNSGVKRVVFLSSIGAHLEQNSGIIQRYNEIEAVLNKLQNVSITFMRPTSFYYNLLAYIPTIKNQGIIAGNYGADEIIPWVSPNDIAQAIADELLTPLDGRKVRYVASEELTGHETARILGNAIGKPDLKWVLISDEEVLAGLVKVGIQPKIANGLVEMYAGLYNSLLGEHYYQNRPSEMGKTKLAEYAKEFASIYNQN
ncbi:NAD(P)H-binding protein [Flavobacterium sp. ANB]|uniref:NmrA family NAD(P)-binding protein n=1 Tax=unclassified Flavobacterium TaxID=196869 RepID=UPI0012B86684|nr:MULTISPECIES: NAD(P)H-binding protein [unclassified Flavobacterium]MBF4518247.1 NAD(P)H-binding protein [Flavobacterium sp. ANB]MTD71055.1 NAD(P)H-binding protein [Flavobacterium sp. LC2016-13]